MRNCYLFLSTSLDAQLRGGRPSNVLLVRRKRLLHGAARSAVLLNDLDAAADVELGLHHGVEVPPDGPEVLVVANTLNEVIWLALYEGFNQQSAEYCKGSQTQRARAPKRKGCTYLVLHNAGCLVRQDTDFLMRPKLC